MDVNNGYLLEDLVLTARPDSCKGSWHNQSVVDVAGIGSVAYDCET